MLCIIATPCVLSAPSGTLTLLRLTSSSANRWISYKKLELVRRVTGGMYVPQGQFKGGSIIPLYY